MSSELERLLREGRDVLPEPNSDATERARTGALTAIRKRRPRRLRLVLCVGVALVIAIGVGVGIGAVVAASGNAAKGPVGLGFLPEPGWFAFQTGADVRPGWATLAVASNIPLEDEDVVGGVAEPSGLPYATLLKLPPDGVVIVASFTLQPKVDPWRGPFFAEFPSSKLPLRLSDAVPYIQYGVQVRPEEPLGQYELRATVNDHNVDLHIYFGTPRPSNALRAAAQHQLDRLVIETEPSSDRASARPTRTASGAARHVVDRTVLCATTPRGGLYEVEARAHAGIREDSSTWKQLPFAVVSSGSVGSRLLALDDSLAWITAGRPSGATTMDIEFRQVPVQSWGTVGVKSTRCRSTNARIPLSVSGLQGGVASPFEDEFECPSPRRVLVRVRAVLQSGASLRQHGTFLRLGATVQEARLAVRTQVGKPLVYADVLGSGKARLFTSRTCAAG